MSKSEPLLSSRLQEAALHYLGRYEASVQSLRQVLTRRVERWARASQSDMPPDAKEVIEQVILTLRNLGAVDDARYAETKALALFRGGRSGRAIRAYLGARGIAPELTDDALAKRDGIEPDLEAALRFAQKKRLGRFRPSGSRAEKRDRDLAALGRAGFSWEIARAIVDDDGA